MVYNSINGKDVISTLGPIIHNPDVIKDLENNGVYSVNNVKDLPKNSTVIIRSHGVGKSVYSELEESGINYKDATCPFVSKIHKIVNEKSSDGYEILIAGEKSHPEVVAITGHCKKTPHFFSNLYELSQILVKNINFIEKKVAIVAQTTYNSRIWDKCILLLNETVPNAEIFNTICDATEKRQAEALKLAKNSDIMIIVGGYESSNTKKLFDICSQICTSYHIENKSQLYTIDFNDAKNIGISAGASTPAYIIKEVGTTMSEIIKNKEEEFNFEEAIEQSLKKIYTGNRVKGYITSVNSNEVIVDIGTKHTGYIPMAELSDNPNVKPSDILSVGDEIDLIVIKINDAEGIVTLSKKKVDAMVGFEKVMKAKETEEILTGIVTNVVKGGILVSYNEVKVFIPASQATMRRDENIEDLAKKTVEFKIIEVNEHRSRAVGSIRAVLKDRKAVQETAFFESTEEGATLVGEVKSITDYGVFVDLGGVDGLIRKTDLTWNRIKKPSDIVSIGDKIEVTVKEIDRETKKVSLIYKKEADNPWEIFKTQYEIGSVATVKVVSVTTFGAFAEIIPGVDGLIHISQIANQRINNVADLLKVDQVVEAKITEIDYDKQRISLSMRALLQDEEIDEVDEDETAE